WGEADDPPRMVDEGREALLPGNLAAAPAVGHIFRALIHGRPHRRAQICERGIVRLDQQDVTFRADCRDHVQVERDLNTPADPSGGQWLDIAVLVDYAQAAVGLRAPRQVEYAPVLSEVVPGIRVVECVDDRDGLALASIRRRAN